MPMKHLCKCYSLNWERKQRRETWRDRKRDERDREGQREEGGRNRDRQTERGRQKERNKERERKRDGETERQRAREPESQREREGERDRPQLQRGSRWRVCLSRESHNDRWRRVGGHCLTTEPAHSTTVPPPGPPLAGPAASSTPCPSSLLGDRGERGSLLLLAPWLQPLPWAPATLKEADRLGLQPMSMLTTGLHLAFQLSHLWMVHLYTCNWFYRCLFLSIYLTIYIIICSPWAGVDNTTRL